MEIPCASLVDCEESRGVIIAIDVLCAFVTAAFAFQAGVGEILVTSLFEEAVALRSHFPGALLLEEVDGIPIDGFNLGNSPSRLANLDISEKRLIMRTTAGTQSLVRPRKARRMLAAGLCNAIATADGLFRPDEKDITMVQTGWFGGGWGDEDSACADWIEAHWKALPREASLIQERARASSSGRHFDRTRPDFPSADLEMANRIDCFGFRMEAFQERILLS